jgi:Derlin-2/3
MDGAFFLSALTLALAYTYAQENPNRQLSYFIVTFSAKYLPYSMLAMTFVMGSPTAALHQATGLIAAHLYEFLAKIWPEHGGGRKLINTPAFVARWFATPAGVPSQRSFGTAYSGNTTAQNVGQQGQAGAGGGWASGFSQGSWNARGTGRRLGGE